MQIHYEDGYCTLQKDGKSLTLYSSNLLEVVAFDEGGIYETVGMKLPEWLADSIREGFKKETEK